MEFSDFPQRQRCLVVVVMVFWWRLCGAVVALVFLASCIKLAVLSTAAVAETFFTRVSY